MDVPIDAPVVIEFRCNICGTKDQLERWQFHRELAACKGWGANARADVNSGLSRAGSTNIQVYEQPQLSIGYY